MVVGCVVFTLPHFLSNDPNAPGIDGSVTNSYVTQRLTQNEQDIDKSQANFHVNNNYSPTVHNASALYSMNSTYVTTSEFEVLQPRAIPSRTSSNNNAACQSRNPPQPQQYIDNTRLNGHIEEDLDSGKDGDGHQNVRKVEVSRGSTAYGCSYERIGEDGNIETVEPESYGHPLILFMIAQILLGCGGSPLFTLGITYIDDHVPKESSSVYIGKIRNCVTLQFALTMMVSNPKIL